MDWRIERKQARKTNDINKFINSPNFLVREGLLDNPNLTLEDKKTLFNDNFIPIKEKLAKEFIYEAVKDSSWRVRYKVINDNPDVPLEILENLINDNDTRVSNKAKELLNIKKNYIYRKGYDNLITIKLVIPGSCNANCKFCYNKENGCMEYNSKELKENWLNNFLISLEEIMLKIDGKQPVSIDITGNEPTLDPDFFIKVMHKLRTFPLKENLIRITCTTNGINLKKVAPFMKGVVDYINISVHDYDYERRKEIFKTYSPTDDDYKEMIISLLNNGINASAISVISNEIMNFEIWRDKFIDWAQEIGFVSLRFRHNVYSDYCYLLDYMEKTINNNNFNKIYEESAADTTWCQLSTNNGFLIYFLKGVIDTYKVSPGIEYIIHDDGKLYADFNKTIPIEEYQFPIGYVFDKKIKKLKK